MYGIINSVRCSPRVTELFRFWRGVLTIPLLVLSSIPYFTMVYVAISIFVQTKHDRSANCKTSLFHNGFRHFSSRLILRFCFIVSPQGGIVNTPWFSDFCGNLSPYQAAGHSSSQDGGPKRSTPDHPIADSRAAADVLRITPLPVCLQQRLIPSEDRLRGVHAAGIPLLS